MLYEVIAKGAEWLTLVVRASDEAEASQLAETAAREYQGEEFEGVALKALDPNGPPGVLIEDPS